MSLEALVSNELPNFLIYDTINASDVNSVMIGNVNNEASSSSAAYFLDNADACNALSSIGLGKSLSEMLGAFVSVTKAQIKPVDMMGQGKRKRRRKVRSCRNKEEAENQRMTHIAVERNRRRQMNEHLAVLRSMMPEFYIQRGDQASIVGGAIDFVKELEQLLQSLETQKTKLKQQQHQQNFVKNENILSVESESNSNNSGNSDVADSFPFAQFFTYPQYSMRNSHRDYVLPENRSAIADIEVTLIETHANLRILSAKRPRQLLKMVAGLHTISLTVLHLNVTTLDSMVLYSLSVKLEEGCSLTTVDDIATAVHHMLSLIQSDQLTVQGQ